MFVTLQGKGGCGKSLLSLLVVQYLRAAGSSPVVVDADPVNKTIGAFPAVSADLYDVVSDGDVDPQKFDALVERILTTESDFVIDNGASTFVPLSNYLVTNGVAELLAAHGRELVINCVVVGGESQADTFLALVGLAEQFQGVRIVCWVNEFFGPVGGDVSFEDTATFKAVRSKLWGVVRLERLADATFGRDFRRMMREHLLFDEAINSGSYMIMEKQRLSMIRRNIFAEIAKANM